MNIFNGIANFYKEPPAIEPLTDKEQIDKTYAKWRMRIFLSMFFGYIIFYTCRKNLSAAIPALHEALGYSMTELGLLSSSLYFTYAAGKFINGVIADNTNVKKILPTALFISALANILFVAAAYLIPSEAKITFFGLPPFSILLWFLAFLWGVNGWFQSMGFPPIAKNLSYWFANKERGIKWSLWSSSHELGTYLSMVLSGYLITHFSWQMVFIVPAGISILYCYFFYKNLQDKPSSIGLPDIEKYKDPNYVEPVQQKDDEAELTYNDIFKKYILKNPTVWMLAIAYVFVYVVRNGTVDWLAMYQVTEKHISISSALSRTKYLPLIGVFGTIGAGFVSDKLFKSRRAPVNIICLAALPIILYLFSINVNSGYNIPLDIFYISLMGIFTCAPQVLIGGISAVESSSKKVASAVTGFCGMFGYVGSILSGVGTGYIVDKFS